MSIDFEIVIIDEDDDDQNPEESEQKSPGWWHYWVRWTLTLCMAAILARLVTLSRWESSTLPNGVGMVTVHYWTHILEFTHGESPTWQKVTFSDGTVFEGPIRDGIRHGRWRTIRDGGEKLTHYWYGKPVAVDSAIEESEP